ncbi:uncharacterized protein KNAG_0F03490 [Huiozyma naganishii CBS 8797]|uniref:PUM-HD domain-containing protein n=1 Tax=Huiozyma naganishii (strain ATCC MYA-139 / BCRC 22969 / CBS 8797 / KCTC 17520 / NBRC 10181 / NCYC 3082 / Yp74L-3) TaxID=1071383 RepID=J7S8P5_HUIN7|nr:hypothetical protein KNAG_0F03490 [Kazachstania naganishii CBS 8797]CCK71011.1 hypothetical protein KNAG_0F03490 [Kazachstania naganishii CBS 8797]
MDGLADVRDTPHKLGSYRGTPTTPNSKFSDKFSSFLPSSLSARFHKPKMDGENKLMSSVINNEVISNPHDFLGNGDIMGGSGTPLGAAGTSNATPLVNFPSGSNTILESPVTRSRQRTNTVPVQWGLNLPNLMKTESTYSENSIWSEDIGRKRSQSMATYESMPSALPIFQDDVDPTSLNWITTNQKNVPPANLTATLIPTSTIAVSNIFPMQTQSVMWSNAMNMTSVVLGTLFSQFGKIVSVRTLQNLFMAIIEFESVESAILALETMQDKEISIVGVPSRITFARILSYSPTESQSIAAPRSMTHDLVYNGTVKFQLHPNGMRIPIFVDQYNSNSVIRPHLSASNSGPETCPFPLPPPSLAQLAKPLQHTLDELGAKVNISRLLSMKPCNNMGQFAPMPDAVPHKQFQTPKLREIRKSLDNNLMSTLEIEQLALVMLDELPELSLDYLGNTIVQRLYDKCGTVIRDIILRKLADYLSLFGIHKSGTWVCQKVIKLANTARSKQMISRGIELYCTSLSNDQFGNYVIQETIKLGYPWNQFIFDNVLVNFWNVCSNRYGARAVRACLESTEGIVQSQIAAVSSAIIQYGQYLIIDHNGALLITWLLDTCHLPKRYEMLTNHILSYLGELCCHKLGSLTILKILNSRGNDTCKQLILETIFELQNPHNLDTLRYVLRDHTLQGSRCIYKMVTSRLVLDAMTKQLVLQRISSVLAEDSSQHYHRLTEECNNPS